MSTQELEVFNEGHRIDFIELNGEIFFTADEIGRHLGYGNPAHAIHKLFRNHENELKHYSTETKTVSVDGKMRETRAFTEEGVYILSMLARTNTAKKFRARIALLLRRVRREQAEHMASLARQSGYEQGLAEATALPAVQIAVKQAHLDGIKEGARVQKRQDRLLRLEKILAYRDKGLTWQEITRLTGCSKDAMRVMLNKARALFAKTQRTQGAQGAGA